MPPPKEAESLLERLGRADCDEDVVGAAPAGERAHLRHRVARRRVEGVGGAEGESGLELARRRVEGDDRLRPADERALHAVEADPARADDDDARADGDLGRVDDRAQARDHAAREQRGDVERYEVRHDGELRDVDDHLLGERAGVMATCTGSPSVVWSRPPASIGNSASHR